MLVFRRLCVLGRPPGLCRPGVSSSAFCGIRAQSDASDGAPRKIPEVKRITRGAGKGAWNCSCPFFCPVVSLEKELGSNRMAVGTAMGTEYACWVVYSQMT